MLDGDAGSSAGAPVRAPAADPDLLLRVQFGPSVRDSIRRRIVRYAKRLLRQDDAHAPEERRASAHRRHYADRHGRKRRRASSASDESEDYATGRGGRRSDIDCAQGYEQTIALYSRAAGFDLDAARGDASDLDVRYEHGTLAVVGLTADSRQALGNPCFNCAMPGHELRDCPMPVDEDRTDANRRAFREKGPGQFSGRLYLAVEDEKRAGEMRERLRPGLPLSAELCEALGLKSSDEVPAYINNMYMYGYPPAYLGHDVVQDVLQTRSVATLQPPPTPTLHIYHDADDFDRAHAAPSDECSDRGDSTAHDKGAEAKIQTPTKGDDVESDEEGAVSESELAAETNGTVGDGPAPTRNIPLVHYTGLDLKQFDFDSTERPGRPIRAQESGRPSHTGYNSTRYASRHAEGGHRYRDRDWEQDDYDPRSYYHTHYPAPYTPAQPYADGWSEMPAGYYGALGRYDPGGPDGYETLCRPDMYYGQRVPNGRAAVLRAAAPSPQTPSSSRYASQSVDIGPMAARGTTAALDSPRPAAPHSPDPADSDGELKDDGGELKCGAGELEDGECDMEESE